MSTPAEKSASLESSIIPQGERASARAVMENPENRGKSIQEIGRELTVEQIRDGTYEGEGVTLLAPLEKALKAEQKAALSLEAARTIRGEALALTQKWEEQIARLLSLRAQREFVASVRRRAGEEMDSLQTRIRLAFRDRSYEEFVIAIGEIATREAALILIEKFAEKGAAELAAHCAEMRKWGATNGVPNEILATICD